MKRTNYDYAPEVKLEDGSTVEILYYLGEYSIIRTEEGEDAISSDLINPQDLAGFIINQ